MKTRISAAVAFAVALGLTLPGVAAEPLGAYHLYRPGVKAAMLSKGASTMLYYAGPVIATAKVAVVIWGTGVNKITVKKIGPFFSAIVDSTYVDQLVQYSTNLTGVNGKPGTDQTIGRGSYLGKFTITPVNTSKNLTDKDVQTELKGQIASGALPENDTDTVYMVYFPANITISLGSAKSCVAFGAYHEATADKITSKNVFYGVMPDCGGGFSNITYASSHEYAEAMTDAIPTPGSNPAYPQAWNTSDGYEIADLCEGESGTLSAEGKSYVVTQVFLNSTNTCSKGNYTSP